MAMQMEEEEKSGITDFSNRQKEGFFQIYKDFNARKTNIR